MMVTTQHRKNSRTANCLRISSLGLFIGTFAALSSVHAAKPVEGSFIPVTQAVAGVKTVDPAKQIPGGVSVTGLDFKRSEGGAGKLIMRFSGEGAHPDMRRQGSSVVINVRNVALGGALERNVNVADFATPVQRINATQAGAGSQIVLTSVGNFETQAYQLGREYVVEIVPRSAQSAKTAVGATNPAQQTAEAPERIYSGPPVNYDFQSIPVRTVLQLMANDGKINIVVSDSVVGDVTMRLENVPWDQALDMILRTKGLDKRRSNNVVWIAPQSEIAKYEQEQADARLALEERQETVTEYIPINYSNAEDIAKMLTEESKTSNSGGGAQGGGGSSRGFLSSRGSIGFDKRTNTLLLIDIPPRVENIKKLISQLDRPVDQVSIDARIVIAEESFARDLGAKFGISGSKDKVNFSGDLESNRLNQNARASAVNSYNTAYDSWVAGGMNGPAPRFTPGPITRALNVDLPSAMTNAGKLALSILNAGYLLDIELSALQTEGRGETIANPRVVTSNQKEAIITQGREYGYVTITGSGATGGAAAPNVQFKDIVLELKVVPTITNDGRVFLALEVKKDDALEAVNLGSFGYVPQLAKRYLNTAVLVEDGQTVAIGGVYEFTERSDLSKVPFLGDIPFLGNLFKKRAKNRQKAELLIFVTPKIIKVTQTN